MPVEAGRPRPVQRSDQAHVAWCDESRVGAEFGEIGMTGWSHNINTKYNIFILKI